MKPNTTGLYVVVALFVLGSGVATAQVTGINPAASSAAIKFDDVNSFDPLSNPGGLYSQANPVWAGASLAISQVDPTTFDSASGDIESDWLSNPASYNINLGNNTPLSLSQPVGNTGFADLSFTFTIEYGIGAGGLLSALTQYPTFLASGTVQNASFSYAAIRGTIDYYGVNTAGLYNLVESVNYNWLYNTPGTFVNQVVTGVPVNGTLPNLGPNSPLTVTGYLLFEVDPASFTVTTVPEPASAAVVLLGGLGLLLRSRRGRMTS
jgi:hypothetical protein